MNNLNVKHETTKTLQENIGDHFYKPKERKIFLSITTK